MQSDAKVPDPAPRGVTVPAVAVVVLVLTGAIWGVGLFLLGRQTAPPVEVLDANSAAQLASLNRIDQAIVRGDPAEVLKQLQTLTLPEGPIGHTALELRRARVTALAVERAAKEEAASPAAVLRRLKANLWQVNYRDTTRVGESSSDIIRAVEVPVEEKTSTQPEKPELPKPEPTKPQVAPTPKHAPLAELTFAGEAFIPDARIVHPIVVKRVYVLHPTKGLLRSDDAGLTWRSGLEPLQRLKGWQLSFTSGDQPLLFIWGLKMWDQSWLFNDVEDAFFP